MTVGSAAFLTGPAPAALQPVPPLERPPMPRAHDWPNGRILIAGPQAVIALDLQRILRRDEPECQWLREFVPLAGTMLREKRRQARDLCGYRH